MFVSLKSWLSGSIQLISLLAILLSATSAALGQAQSNAADLQGTVRDSTGAVVTGATVTARNPDKNLSRTATTNDEGFYRIINVTPGDYEITVAVSDEFIQHNYDRHEREYHLRVRSGTDSQTPEGVIDMRGQWATASTAPVDDPDISGAR